MDENLDRWIWASLTKHFDAYKQSYQFLPQGYDRIEQYSDSFQLRINGPKINNITNNYSEIEIGINMLVTTIKDETDDHKVHRLVGTIGKGFTNSIEIREYGDNSNLLLGCFELNSEITITHFGAMENTTNVLQSTIEADYKWRR
jgi:hypothetical protein